MINQTCKDGCLENFKTYLTPRRPKSDTGVHILWMLRYVGGEQISKISHYPNGVIYTVEMARRCLRQCLGEWHPSWVQTMTPDTAKEDLSQQIERMLTCCDISERTDLRYQTWGDLFLARFGGAKVMGWAHKSPSSVYQNRSRRFVARVASIRQKWFPLRVEWGPHADITAWNRKWCN